MNNLKRLRPINSSSRGVILINKKHLWRGNPEGSLSFAIKKTGGRNNMGRITCDHMGGGAKKVYRKVDFKRNSQDNINAIVQRIEYDPNRTAFIALIKYEDGKLSYILCPEKLNVGDKVVSGESADILPGNCCLLENIPIGTFIHNVELNIGKGGVFGRSAGAFIQLVGKENGLAILEMPSKEKRFVSLKCRASIGIISNGDKFNENLGKAGRSRHRGKRSRVRGVAMNPVDHCNGGNTSGGKQLSSPNGRVVRGLKTRKNKKSSTKMIIKRRLK